MIIADGPALDPFEAARRAGAGAVFLGSPGDGDVAVERVFVASDPIETVRGSSLGALDEAWRRARVRWAPALPGVPAGVGYLSYDLGRQFERLRGTPPAPSGWPELEVRFFDAVWTFGAGGSAIWAVNREAADRLRARLTGSGPAPTPLAQMGPLRAIEPAERHLDGVGRVLEYLRAGDVYQVNLARRLEAALPADAAPRGWSLLARLSTESPAPHAFWLAPDEAGRGLVGNSPERFIRVSVDGRIETRPIKGTRPRADDPATLAAHPKDRAEHAMIVDLERNDLGRVCITGSVVVESTARIVTLPTVHHLVSTVTGQLRPDVDLPALLRATFPGGSVTGAPKIRAMEIIDELEAIQRGPYTGATGWFGAAGDLDLAIAIRTALIEGERLTLWVGGGVVADSDPEEELRETVAKAEAFARLARR